MTESRVAEAMRTIVDDVAVPSPPADLWRRGRRRHRRRLTAMAAVAGALAAAISFSLVRGQPHRVAPADSPPRVPSTVYAPLPFQRTVQQDPAGPAALIVTGEGAFRGSDALGGYEGRTVVVSRDGRYRLVNGAAEVEAGQDAHLSPDGRYLAVNGPVDGASYASFGATSLVDLTTGRVRVFDAGSPTAWSPDGRQLLVRADRTLTLIDVDSGESRHLFDLSVMPSTDPRVAFSPDGRLLAVLHYGLHVVHVASATSRPLFRGDLSQRQLAGPGAWTPDGRLALWDATPSCPDGCPAVVEAGFELVYVDPESGNDVAGLPVDRLKGGLPRLLGWHANGSALIETRQVGDGPQVKAFHPGGGRTLLVDLPSQAHHVDVAADLLAAGRFGASPPAFGDRFQDWLIGLVPRLLQVLGVIVVLVAARWYWRRRRA